MPYFRVLQLACLLCLQDKCFQYWPLEDSVTYGDYTVEIKGDTLCDTFSLRDLVLTYGQVGSRSIFSPPPPALAVDLMWIYK